MKNRTKIITASVSVAVICCVSVFSAAMFTSANSVSVEERDRIELQELQKKTNAPDELKHGKYYYGGDKSSDFWIEVSDNYTIEYKSSDMMKATEMICAQSYEVGSETYKSAIEGGYEFFTEGKRPYAINSVDMGSFINVFVFIGGVEPGSNYEKHTGPGVDYIDENTLDGGYDENFIYVEE